MTKLTQGTQKPDNRTYSRNGASRKKKNQIQPVEWESVAWLIASQDLSGNNAKFVSVHLIGEKNQVILKYLIRSSYLP